MPSNKHLLLVSFDALGGEETELLDRSGPFWTLAREGALFDRTRSVEVSNTYPVHASVSTGRLPREHKVVSNTAIGGLPGRWRTAWTDMKSKTIFQAAAEKGLESAAVMWPLTVGAPRSQIRHNFPEIPPSPGVGLKSAYLRSGSLPLVLRSYLRFGRLLSREDPTRGFEKDRFATAVMADLLRRRPGIGLAALHLTAYDWACHHYGKGSRQSLEAISSLDRNLGKVLEHIQPGTDVLVFSDHSELNHSRFCDPERELALNGGVWDREKAFFYLCGGVCFCFAPGLDRAQAAALEERCLALEGVERTLTGREMRDSGFEDEGAAFGLGARTGWVFDHSLREKAEHGYLLDKEHYNTFIMTSWKEEGPCADVLDVPRLAAARLGLDYEGGFI